MSRKHRKLFLFVRQRHLRRTLERMTVSELRSIAKHAGLTGYTRLNKSELIDLLVSHFTSNLPFVCSRDCIAESLRSLRSFWGTHRFDIYGLITIVGAILAFIALLLRQLG